MLQFQYPPGAKAVMSKILVNQLTSRFLHNNISQVTKLRKLKFSLNPAISGKLVQVQKSDGNAWNWWWMKKSDDGYLGIVQFLYSRRKGGQIKASNVLQSLYSWRPHFRGGKIDYRFRQMWIVLMRASGRWHQSGQLFLWLKYSSNASHTSFSSWTLFCKSWQYCGD